MNNMALNLALVHDKTHSFGDFRRLFLKIFFVFPVVFFLFVLTGLAEDTTIGKLYDFQGRVSISKNNGQSFLPAEKEAGLHEGNIVRTGPKSRAFILLADQSLMTLAEQSEVALTRVMISGNTGWGQMINTALTRAVYSAYKLFNGKMRIRAFYAMDIETPTSVIGVRGTEFGLEVTPTGDTMLAMLEGSARMSNDYGSVMVNSGEQGMAEKGKAPVKRILVNPADAVQWSLHYPVAPYLKDYALVSGNREVLASELEKIDRLLADQPGSLTLLIKKGRILYDLDVVDEAQTIFKQMLKKKAMSFQALEGLGWCSLRQDMPEQAIAYFKRMSTPTELSIIGLSLAYQRLSKTEQAQKILFQALDRKPIRSHALILARAAETMLMSGNPGKALDLIHESLAEQENALAYRLLSTIMIVQNKNDAALSAAQKAVALSPCSSAAHVDLAWVYQALFQLDRALAETSRALALDPDNIRALLTYSRLQFGFGYLEIAEDHVDRVLARSSQEPEACTLKGFLCLARRQTDKAMNWFNKARDLDSGQSRPHLGLGIALIRQGETPEGIQEMLIAALLSPNESLNFSYLGKALYQNGDFKGAEKTLIRAKQLDPNDPSPYLYAGIMKTDLNQVADGIRELEKAVALNDNRAVYRSRFLLDQDRAVKNVDLARTYASLGLSAMARNRALLSLKDDPNNSAGHLFMARSLIFENDRGEAGASELLKFYLLQPVNKNSFNTFNDYTSFFEKPDLNIGLDIFGGNHGTGDYMADFTGSRHNIAGRQLFQYYTTDGYRDDNFNRYALSHTVLKFQLGLNHDFLLLAETSDGKNGDRFDDAMADAVMDPDYTGENTISRMTLGYHARLSPGSDVMVVAQKHSKKSDTFDGPENENWSLDFLGDEFWLVEPAGTDGDWEDHVWQLSAVHQLSLGSHKIAYGAEYFNSRSKYSSLSIKNYSLLYYPELSYIAVEEPYRGRIKPEYYAFFLHDTWHILPQLMLDAGLFYEDAKTGLVPPILSSNTFDSDHLSPRIGLIYSPARRHTFRLGYYQYLQNISIALERLQPTDVAGFTIGHNALPGSMHKEVAVAWDVQISDRSHFSTRVFNRKRQEKMDTLFTDEFVTKTRRFYGVEAEWNRMFLSFFGLNLSCAYIQNREEAFDIGYLVNPKRRRDDYLVRLAFYFHHPTGWKASLELSHINQELKDADEYEVEEPSSFELVNLSVSKELLNKRMSLGMDVNNLFDKEFNLITDYLQTDSPIPAREILFKLSCIF